MRCVLVQHTQDFRTKTYGKNKKVIAISQFRFFFMAIASLYHAILTLELAIASLYLTILRKKKVRIVR